jgi:outer membrane protein assembly factor BamB
MYRTQPETPTILVACMGTRVVGIERLTGQRAWVHDTSALLTRVVVIGDRIFAAGSQVVCLRYPTGEELWTAPAPFYAHTFLVDGEEVFIATSEGELAALATKDGRLLWHDPFKGWGNNGIALALPGVAAQVDHQ